MPRKLTPQEAENFLRNIDEPHTFYVNNGPVLTNIEQLPNVLKNMEDHQFNHHVNSERNDFSSWIKDVIGDSKLANQLSKVKTKRTTITKLKKRLKELKNLKK